MKDTIKFDIFYGRCAKCQGPVFFSQTIDWEGNRVNTFHCWNGHYERIEIAQFHFVDPGALTREQVESILPFVGFVRLEDGA